MPFLNTLEIEAQEPLPGWPGRFFSSITMTYGYYDTVEGADLHEHSHPNEEVWHVIEGELEVSIGGDVQTVGAGGVKTS